MANNDQLHQFSELVRMLERRLTVLLDENMVCSGVTLAQCQALVEIGRAGKISLIELSKLLNLDNSTMSRTVNNLVTNGMVERELNSFDRRYVSIKLTPEGEQSFESIEKGIGSNFELIFKAIPAEKQEQVSESLRILLAAISRIGF